ncbi:GntR family transcriptional regulator [Peribacillus butanolivorans]|uniref:GntR family transcriptional regulator n=1 Tax=Peribacillus butanolivorans TaxID=421767 RepID=UPI00366CD31D
MKEIQKTELLHNQVYQILKGMIIDGEYQPGERLVETRVAERIGVSRGTIREAFQMLLKDYLLVRNGKALSVYNPSVQDIIDIYQCRISLESLAVKLATQNITDEELSKLAEVINDSKLALNMNDTKKLTQLNQEFHDIIDSASHNHQLIQLCEVIKTKILYIRTSILKVHFKNFSDFVEDHERILLAIQNKDPVKAEQEMHSHIEKSFNTIKSTFKTVIDQ